MKVIAIDFDKTASINPDKIKKLYECPKNFIVIYTSRSSSIRIKTEKELLDLGIPYHALVMDKLRADVYIDDKNAGGLQWIKS